MTPRKFILPLISVIAGCVLVFFSAYSYSRAVMIRVCVKKGKDKVYVVIKDEGHTWGCGTR